MRLLEDHLSPLELASLPDSPAALAAGGPDLHPLSQHLQQCQDCSSLAETYWSLRHLRAPSGSAIGSDSCPHQTVWLALAQGLDLKETSSLLAHAAGCAKCAFDLQEAIHLMRPEQLDPAAGSSDSIEGLASVTPEWQRRVARLMSAASSIPPATTAAPTPKLLTLPRPRRIPAWISLPAAAAIVCAAVLAGFALWRSAHPSDARLLALAYNKQRTLVLRIPGAEPVPMASITRSANSPTHGLTEPAELLELHLRAQQHLDQTPNSPYWHQILGEIDLLQQDGFAARRNFEIAQATGDTLPNLLPDLAAAWFELGDSTGTSMDYAQAGEFYLRELHNLDDHKPHPTGPALLHYNLAICWERQNLNENALADLRAALALETSAAWRKSIEAEIRRLTAPAAKPISANPLETDGYEQTLSDVTTNLLPHWSDTPEAHQKILATAALGVQHNDLWLSDWIATPHTPLSREADEHLAAALRAEKSGEAETSLVEANRAIELYTKLHNIPGRLSSEYLQTYSFQRLGKDKYCIATADTTDSNLKRYQLLQSQQLLESAICTARSGGFTRAQQRADQVVSIATASSLPQIRLYAIGVQASILKATGRTSAAWQGDVVALSQCDQTNCSPIRRYAFLYEMVRSAQDLDLLLTATTLMQTAVQIVAASPNTVSYAYALETLGRVSGRAGDFATSANAFTQAASVAHYGKQATMSAIYQAEWQIDQAAVLSRQGSSQSALTLLERSAPIMLTSDYVPGRTKYYRQASVAQLDLRQFDDALTNALAAVHEAEQSLPHLNPTAKEQWVRENAPIYSQLVKVHLARGDYAAALQTWERYRSIPYTSAGSSTPAAFNSPGKTPSDFAAPILVLARVDDLYVGWLATPDSTRPLHAVILGDSARLHQSAVTFYRLCADRDSSLDDIHAVGAQLYQALILPLLNQTPSSSQQLFVDLDPSLAMLPIAALTSPNGSWLSDSKQITVLPAWWSLDPKSSLAAPSIKPTQHMVIVDGFGPSNAPASETSEIAGIFDQPTVIEGPAATPASVRNTIASAELFHFEGHADTSTGIILAADSAGKPILTPDSLHGLHLHQCHMAVLAACNTTAADPDRIETLPDMRNALLLSGAQTVVASNWDVDDRGTRSLMLSFYKNLAAGLPPSQSLQSAQQSVGHTAGWQHPFYWAPFELFTN